MRNLKVSAKLILSFVIVIVMAVVVGTVGIIGMYNMNVGDDKLYNGNYLPSIMAGDISQIIVEQRVNMRNFVVYDVNEDADIFKSAENSMAESKTKMETLLKEYEDSIILQEDQDAFDEFCKVYNNEWLPLLDEVHTFGVNNQAAEAKQAMTDGIASANTMNELTTKLQNINLDDGERTVESNTSLFLNMAIAESVVLVGAIAVSMFLAFYISGLISKPVTFMKDVLLKIGTKGELEFTEAEYKRIEEYASVKDEVGESVNMLQATVRRLVNVGDALKTVAAGDLTAEVELLSDKDTMGVSLHTMIDNLNAMFEDINISTAQVATGAKQIADGAQALAQGSTEQAAAVQELSSSISEIADKTRENAGMATNAANLAGTIKQYAEKGSRQMDEMMTAVKEINQASQSINKVIKVIDDIAFQTNILALNAAVEAARAGQHGKGFAVVAEEVRNLAAKSSEAAKDTSSLIANSMEKAELGARIADETAASLTDIVNGINESSQLVGDIAQSSEEQSVAITQINKGIDQVAQVVQQNSATAEESAAASEEMSSQGALLDELIAQFKLKETGNRVIGQSARKAQKQLSSGPASSSGGEGGFGKY